MYHSKGNYEAFVRPERPKDADKKSAYLVGSGLASLSAACFLVRDGQLKPHRIHILEELSLPGGACDGIMDSQKGFVIRGGREMEDHFECLWDLFHSIPSLEKTNTSVLDEFYRLNKVDPNSSLTRATANQGEDAHTNGKFGLSVKASKEIMKFFLTSDDLMYDKKITDFFTEDFFNSNFWLYWRTMFAFEDWHSALEMKRYLQRYIHHIGGLPDLSALKFTKYNQYESLILPLVKYLETAGVHFQYDTMVTNVVFEFQGRRKIAKQLYCVHNGAGETIDLLEDDLVFITNGSCTENSTLGDHDHPAVLNTAPGACWELWRNIARQHPSFGNPDKFCTKIPETKWESATVTLLDDRIPPYIEKITKRQLYTGRVVTGGPVSIKDSGWLMSWTMSRQPHFKAQPKNQLVAWVYGLFPERKGDFIKKPMQDCTGQEITEEWLYHLGVPKEEIHEMAANSASCIPCMMPYITAFFMPRAKGDRPKVVPDGSVNFAFIGQFADTERDTVFTTEYSVRTAMEAVYTLLDIDRGVPEVFGSCYDIRFLLDAATKMLDGQKLIDQPMPWLAKALKKPVLKKLEGTVIKELLEKYQVI
jgi:oleate hydratase